MPIRFHPMLQVVLKNIFGDEEQEGPVAQAFRHAGIYGINDLLILEEADINELTWDDDEGTERNIPFMDRKRLRSVIKWAMSGDETKSQHDWENLDIATIIHYRREPTTPATLPMTPSTPFTPTVATPPVSTTINTTLEFKKGIKRSVSDYKNFQNDKKWIVWKNHLIGMAEAHDVSEVLDPDY